MIERVREMLQVICKRRRRARIRRLIKQREEDLQDLITIRTEFDEKKRTSNVVLYGNGLRLLDMKMLTEVLKGEKYHPEQTAIDTLITYADYLRKINRHNVIKIKM